MAAGALAHLAAFAILRPEFPRGAGIMKIHARLFLMGAALVVLSAPAVERARAAPILLDAVARLATPVDDAAEFCLPGWRLDSHSRCVPKRRRWWFR